MRLKESITNSATQYAEAFGSARPFQHVVIDDFFPDDFLARLQNEFTPFDHAQCRDEAGLPGLKATKRDIVTLGPAYREFDRLMRSEAWLDFLGQITGIDDLLFDPYYYGGGTHENKLGQDLDFHIDFNVHPYRGWQRRLNVIFFLNEDWQQSWGGNLLLCDDPWKPSREQVRQQIEPVKNRMVLFATHDHSWHGFDRIALPDAGPVSRRSLALYFYTELADQPEIVPHQTVYVDESLPDFVRAGHTLSETDAAELKRLYARRDQHIKRLYMKKTAMDIMVEALQTRYEKFVERRKRTRLPEVKQ